MKIKFWCRTHDPQSKEQEVMEFEDELSDDDLEAIAKEFYENRKEPSWGFERLPDASLPKEGK